MGMNDRDKAYLLKELTRTIDESDSTAAFCLCQRWILKDALALLKEQETVVRCKDFKWYQEAIDIDGKPFIRCNGNVRVYGHTKPNWFCTDGERKVSK